MYTLGAFKVFIALDLGLKKSSCRSSRYTSGYTTYKKMNSPFKKVIFQTLKAVVDLFCK